MNKKKPMIKMAIAYDFDGTLAKGNIQENSFLPKVGINNPNDFWNQVKEQAQNQDMNEILSYMLLLVEKAKEKQIDVTREDLMKHGEKVEFFNGVESFFERINQYAKSKNIDLEHYIISSGTKEMIEGTSIAKYFKVIFASSFIFKQDDKGNEVPYWPATAIDYTSKTQYLYRISKGILNTWDSSKINKTMAEESRAIRFENMIYIGDGETDIPAMTLLKSKKGASIVVYDESRAEKQEQAQRILENGKANYAVPIDYSKDQALDRLLKMLIDKVSISEEYGKYQWNEEQNEEETHDEILKILGVDCIALNQRKDNCILLAKDDWDDYGYRTMFRISRIKNGEEQSLGKIKIASTNQDMHQHTLELMGNITALKKLDDKFVSRIGLTNYDLSDQEKEALNTLFNAIKEDGEIENEYGEVISTSLLRGAPKPFVKWNSK